MVGMETRRVKSRNNQNEVAGYSVQFIIAVRGYSRLALTSNRTFVPVNLNKMFSRCTCSCEVFIAIFPFWKIDKLCLCRSSV